MKIELFNAIYGCYYSTIYHILKDAGSRELSDSEFHDIIRKNSERYGFSATTSMFVYDAITIGENDEIEENKDAWPFFDKHLKNKLSAQREGIAKANAIHTNRLKNIKYFPLSTIEKMWLKSIYSDPRIKLFLEKEKELPDLGDVEPLFEWDDFVLIDQYLDGDPFDDEHYIEMFHKVLNGVQSHSRLEIQFRKPSNKINYGSDGSYEITSDRGIGTIYIDTEYIEYSERDDKFRLIGNNPKFGRNIVNISSIESCKKVEQIEVVDAKYNDGYSRETFQRDVVFELVDDKNTLERFLLNFSHYNKVAETVKGKNLYRITVTYDETDETDIIIRTLSFGPHVKAVAPPCFVNILRDRLRQQKVLEKEH